MYGLSQLNARMALRNKIRPLIIVCNTFL